jgi:hypothetical protein
MNNTIIKEKIDIEIDKIVCEYWSFLDKSYNKVKKKYYHRTELKDIAGIDIIKSQIYDRLGYAPVFFFLNELFTDRDYKGGAYRLSEKGLLLLYQILYGKSLRDMGKIIPYSSYYDIYKDFWLSDNANVLNKKIDYMLENMFSNIKIRILSSRLYNPNPFKHVTMFLDGHDSRIEYQNINIHKKELYSFKFKKPGVRTQVLTDINDMIIYVSNSKYCKNNVDGEMFLKMKVENIVEKEDCIAFDGGYYYYIDRFIESFVDYNYQNFIYPYRKSKNVELTNEKLEFNKMFGSYRSKIETVFADVGNKFNKFDNTKAVTKTTNIKGFTLQFKVASLLTNMKRFLEKYNIEINEHVKLWENGDFDYVYRDNSENDDDNVDFEEIYYNENYKNITDIQNNLLNLNIDKNKRFKKLKQPKIIIESMEEL